MSSLRCIVKMKVLVFLFMNFIIAESILFSNTTGVKPDFDVIVEIVSNYLKKYIRHKTSIVSILKASSCVQQKYIQKDLFEKFVTSPKMSNFAYNILNQTIDQTRQENTHSFNIIFIDGVDPLG